MPVVATPASPVLVTLDEVRRFMMDFPDKNELLEAVEYTQADIEQGIRYVTDAFNAMTPLTSIAPETWPQNLRYLLLLGISWYLVRGSQFLQVRNQLTYQDGDIAPIGRHDKFPLYMSLYQSLRQEWDELTKNAKIQMNLESAYGSLGSGYVTVTRFHHS